jgi:DNA-directed RNA polymerase specialized sigma24 family protein
MNAPQSRAADPAAEGLLGTANVMSFASFFDQRHRDLFSALWLITRNRHEAEELMQDALLRVWERWDRIAAMEDPEGYLYRTAMNLFRSDRRDGRRRDPALVTARQR